ncbi:MAG: M60 family metallopeptidase [Luteolibacter sp.]
MEDDGLLTLTGTTPDLLLDNGNGGFNIGGFTSTQSINTLTPVNLAATDTVTMSATIDSIGGTGELRANGIDFGMSSAADLRGGGSSLNLLLGIEAANTGSDVNLVGSFVGDADVGFDILQSSLEDGFRITLTANSTGYRFVLTDIVVRESGKTTAVVSGTFSGTEFVDYFSGGHFHLSAQKWNNGNLEVDLSEASIDVTSDPNPLADAMLLLKSHIDGSNMLTAAEIDTQAGVINANAGELGDTADFIIQALDLVDAYETIKGALFLNSTTNANGGFSRTDTSNENKALAVAMLAVYQAILDDVFNADNLAAHRSILDGARFLSADYWPGAVTPPADPDAIYSVQINASQPKAWGYPVAFQDLPARRPTGAYLAPGSVARVTVPAALVNQGFEIRVGAHVANLASKSSLKRMDRVSLTYPITSLTTEVANPLGGGIYIEVPYEKEMGLVTVDIQNTVRSPFYSNTVARHTTLEEWRNTERNHPGPWADFESDKFMLNIPTNWINNYDDPATMMAEWDDAMDAVSDLVGLPRIRPKTVLYCQVDVFLDASVFSPGYPQSNHGYNPHASYNGNVDNDYLNGPKFSPYHHLHELGHACFISKFPGELESVVNLLYVPVHHRMFGVSLDQSFSRSIGNANSISRDQAALSWILSENFQAGNAMDGTNTSNNQMKYQHRGFGKYVEIAGLFGWEAVGNFWKSVAEDYENGTTYSTNDDPADSRIVRMSRAAGVDLTPLIHFWGIHPDNPTNHEINMLLEGLPKSALIYDRLVYYQSIVPMDAAGFEAHYQAFKTGIKTNTEGDRYEAMRTGWTQELGELTVSRIQEIIDKYFPDGRPVGVPPVQSVPYDESFEDGTGGWVQSLDDDFDWTLNSGATPTADTGPSAASHGDQYLYLEGDDSLVPAKIAQIECIFDLSTLASAQLRFDYHMFGADIDYLAVDVNDGSGWITDVWIRNGQQHSSSSDAWSRAVVDLTPYAGNDSVIIRIRGKESVLHAADIAIDRISVRQPPATLPYAESFENGLGAWEQSTEDDHDWTRKSGPTPTPNSGPSAASDGSQYLYVEGHDNSLHNKTAQIDCIFDFSTVERPFLSFDYHMYGPYIDFLAIDVFDGSTWAPAVWIRSGQQHGGNNAAWSRAEVDLSSYSGNGEVTLRIRAKQRYWYAADSAVDNIRVEELRDYAYAQWVETAFAGAPGGTDLSATGNPDGDRFTNEMEWALVTDPLVAGEPAMEMSEDNDSFVVTYYRRDPAVTGIDVFASWSSSLSGDGWRFHGDIMVENSMGWSNDVETVTASLPMDANRAFIRINAEASSPE